MIKLESMAELDLSTAEAEIVLDLASEFTPELYAPMLSPIDAVKQAAWGALEQARVAGWIRELPGNAYADELGAAFHALAKRLRAKPLAPDRRLRVAKTMAKSPTKVVKRTNTPATVPFSSFDL